VEVPATEGKKKKKSKRLLEEEVLFQTVVQSKSFPACSQAQVPNCALATRGAPALN